MDKDIQAKVDQFQSAAAKAVLNKIEFCFNSIVTKNEIKTLPEHIFVQVFLPYFAGERKIEEGNDIIVQWISIAGSPTSMVNIVDTNNKYLFTVPPMFDTSNIDNTNKNKGQAFNDIVANYALHKNQLPVIGENYLRNSLSKRLKTLTPKVKTVSKSEQQWLYILNKYGKIKAPNVAGAVVDNTKLHDDELEYD